MKHHRYLHALRSKGHSPKAAIAKFLGFGVPGRRLMGVAALGAQDSESCQEAWKGQQ
jgi:hypothetical protein